jgi:hypothetical protein
MKEAPGSSEMSVLTRATRRNNPEDTILHNVICSKYRILAKKKYLNLPVQYELSALNNDIQPTPLSACLPHLIITWLFIKYSVFINQDLMSIRLGVLRPEVGLLIFHNLCPIR